MTSLLALSDLAESDLPGFYARVGGRHQPDLFGQWPQTAGPQAPDLPAFSGPASPLGHRPLSPKARQAVAGLPLRPPAGADDRDSGPLPVRDAGADSSRPWSGFRTHADEVRRWAMRSPENLACVLVSAPLSAMVPFNIYTPRLPFVMKIMRAIGGQAREAGRPLDQRQVYDTIQGVNRRLARRGRSNPGLAGFGLNVLVRSATNPQMKAVASVWNNRDWLFEKFSAADKAMRDAAFRGATSLDDYAVVLDLYRTLAQTPLLGIHGFQRVKAGFAIQLALNVQGCIDVHNEGIYQDLVKVLVSDPDLQRELQHAIRGVNGGTTDTKIQKYMQVIELLHRELGVDSGWLWDLWVDWVAQFHRAKFPGHWADTGPAFDPADPLAAKIRSALPPTPRQYRTVRDKDGDGRPLRTSIQLAAGDKAGMAVSDAHPGAMVDPDDIVRTAAEDPDRLRLAKAFGAKYWDAGRLRDKMRAAAAYTRDALKDQGVAPKYIESAAPRTEGP